jgi:hypothetical protein
MVNLMQLVYIAAGSVQTDNGSAHFGIWMPGGSCLAASSGKDSRAGSLARTEAHAPLRSLRVTRSHVTFGELWLLGLVAMILLSQQTCIRTRTCKLHCLTLRECTIVTLFGHACVDVGCTEHVADRVATCIRSRGGVLTAITLTYMYGYLSGRDHDYVNLDLC